MQAWFRKQLDRVKRHKWRTGIALLVALLIYPVLGTLALWTGFVEWVARSEDLRLEIDNPSYTIWPGRVHMKSVAIYMNGDTQFILRGQDLTISISVVELIRHRIHVTKLAAHDVSYQMRVQVKDTKGMEERVAAYPKLEGLPGVNTVSEKAAQATESREPSWTVEVDGIDVKVVELWFFEYRYLGDGTLRGGFTVGPGIMEVRTAVQDLGPGQLRFGEKRPVAERLRGQVSCDIPEINPSEHADASFMELVSARANLKADVVNLEIVGAYFAGLEVSRGAGPLELDLFMDKGFLGKRSHLDFQTESVRVKGHGFGVETDWKLAFDAAGAEGQLPLGKSESKSTYVSLAKRDRELTVQIHGHHEEATLDTIRLSGATDLKHAKLRMPNIVSVDLKDLAVLLPDDSKLALRGDRAKASLSLDMDEKYWVTGPIKAEIDRSSVGIKGVNVSGNTWLDAKAWLNPKLAIFGVRDVSLRLRNVGMRVEDEAVSGWWANVSAPKLTFWNSKPTRAEGTVDIRTKNLEPALEALAEKDLISDVIPVLTRLDDFRASTSFRTQGDLTDVTVASESDVWDVSGRVYSNAKQTLMALVVGGQSVSLGIADLGGGLELRPFAKTDWLNSRLAQLPAPLVQMAPAKP